MNDQTSDVSPAGDTLLEGGVQAGDGRDEPDDSAQRADQDEVPAVEFDSRGDRPETYQGLYIVLPPPALNLLHFSHGKILRFSAFRVSLFSNILQNLIFLV